VTLSPKRLENKSQEIIENRKSDLVEIKNIESKERTFLNTVFALEKSDRDVDGFFGKLEVLLHMSPKKPIREKCAQIEVKMSAQLIEIDFDKGIFDALVEYKKNYKNDKLKDIDKKLFKDYLRAYTKMGFDLKAKEQTELKKVNKEISKLSSAFSVNINNYTDNILLGNDDLEGLSDIFIQSLKKEKDKYIVSLDYPEMIPFMETSSNEKKRKQLLDKASKKGGKENLKILSEILKLKDKRAKMLGYKNHPDFIAEDRMSKKGKNVVDFYEPLLEKLEKPGRADLKILEYCKKEQTGDLKEKLQPQDIAYYANILKKQKYNVDEQKLKEYFQLDIVKFEMIEMFGKLFGFEMKKNNKIKL
jgi:thimet oligopeptidase